MQPSVKNEDARSSSPAVSVVIPCYNSAWSIERTLKSVQSQRFRDFEVIIVNDGSTDNVQNVIAPFLEGDRRFRVIDQTNRGLAATRNRGIAASIGALVAPIDADDLWHPDFLGAMVEALADNPSAPFAYGATFRIDEEDRLLPQPNIPKQRHDFHGLISFNSVGSGSAAVFRRSAVLSVGGYDETLRTRSAQGAEDWKLILMLAAGGTPVSVDRKLVCYRRAASGISQGDPGLMMQGLWTVIEDLRAEFPDLPNRWFLDARTTMAAIYVPRLIQHKMLVKTVLETVRAYLLNPLWFRNPAVRDVHVALLLFAFASWRVAVGPNPHLWTVEIDGEYPFAFLQGMSDSPAITRTRRP